MISKTGAEDHGAFVAGAKGAKRYARGGKTALAEEPIYARTYERSQAQHARARAVIPLGAQTFSKSYLQYPQPSPLRPPSFNAAGRASGGRGCVRRARRCQKALGASVASPSSAKRDNIVSANLLHRGEASSSGSRRAISCASSADFSFERGFKFLPLK